MIKSDLTLAKEIGMDPYQVIQQLSVSIELVHETGQAKLAVPSECCNRVELGVECILKEDHPRVSNRDTYMNISINHVGDQLICLWLTCEKYHMFDTPRKFIQTTEDGVIFFFATDLLLRTLSTRIDDVRVKPHRHGLRIRTDNQGTIYKPSGPCTTAKNEKGVGYKALVHQ